MDYSRGWRVSVNRRCLQVFLMVCTCLLKQHFGYVTATPEAAYSSVLDNQGLSNNVPNSKSKLDSLGDLIQLNAEQDKRSSAFFPLRGKKYNQLSGLPMDPWDVSEDVVYSQEDDKRSQFYPLRGKKVPDDLKRASYFMPMRGRKDDDAWSQEVVQEDKRMSSFMPMRGKKKINSLVDSFQHLGKPALKRPMSFFATRGKRMDESVVTSKFQ